MIKNIQKAIEEKYHTTEEYLTDRYPQNYFNYFIDVGTRGIISPWHINYIGKNNPETLCFGYEPDVPYYDQLKKETKDLSNVKVYPHGFSHNKSIQIPGGKTKGVTLKDIITDNNIDVDSRWMIKFDCEGCEYCLLKEDYNIDILKKASHIALEFHNTEMGGNFFKNKYALPDSFNVCENWMTNNFIDSHSIFLTSIGLFGSPSRVEGVRTYVLISQEIMDEKDNLFWKNLL